MEIYLSMPHRVEVNWHDKLGLNVDFNAIERRRYVQGAEDLRGAGVFVVVEELRAGRGWHVCHAATLPVAIQHPGAGGQHEEDHSPAPTRRNHLLRAPSAHCAKHRNALIIFLHTCLHIKFWLAKDFVCRFI